LGSVSMTEQFLKQSPPLKSELDDLEKEIQEKLSAIRLKGTSTQVIAIAGTATTLACMVSGLKEFDETLVNNFILTKHVLKNLVDELCGLNHDAILKKFGPVMKGRQDIILAGAYILLQIMEIFRIQNVSVSSRGIRYGAIVKFIMQAQL
jgi:exopolyphosphatase/guanosine-5'-triphosphate,3'-diphosphate pyrophosphatase